MGITTLSRFLCKLIRWCSRSSFKSVQVLLLPAHPECTSIIPILFHYSGFNSYSRSTSRLGSNTSTRYCRLAISYYDVIQAGMASFHLIVQSICNYFSLLNKYYLSFKIPFRCPRNRHVQIFLVHIHRVGSFPLHCSDSASSSQFKIIIHFRLCLADMIRSNSTSSPRFCVIVQLKHQYGYSTTMSK